MARPASANHAAPPSAAPPERVRRPTASDGGEAGDARGLDDIGRGEAVEGGSLGDGLDDIGRAEAVRDVG